MGVLRRLAGQSALYGLSSVVPRLLNYFLVVLHSRVYVEAEYGVLTELYAYIAILLVVLTFGLETGFFRFASVEDRSAGERTYGTLFYFLGGVSVLFFGLCWGGIDPLGRVLDYAGHSSYLLLTAGILSIDAWSAIVFAKLRWLERPLAFASIKIASVGVNVGLNVLFLLGFPLLGWYDADFGVGYVLVSNIVGSVVAFGLGLGVSGGLPRRGRRGELVAILAFSLPILISGLGGTANEFLDRVFIKWLTPASDPMVDLGLYGANAKIAVLVVLFVQMFKYAAEPFFFAQQERGADRGLYAMVTKYFSHFIAFSAVGVWLYLPVLKYFVGSAYWAGLDVIPVLLLANVLYGLYFNVAFWYKLTKQTWYGVLFTFVGASISVGVNLWLTPSIGYNGAALARVCSYAVMIGLSLWVGQRVYRIPYDYGRIVLGLLLCGGAGYAGWLMGECALLVVLLGRSALLVVLLAVLFRLEGYSLWRQLGALRQWLGLARRRRIGKSDGQS